MKPKVKLTQQQEQVAASQQMQPQTVHEFSTVEAMLRHDALHTPVPPSIARRLKESIDNLPPTSWWQRLFGQ
jgi:hypothetical protein